MFHAEISAKDHSHMVEESNGVGKELQVVDSQLKEIFNHLNKPLRWAKVVEGGMGYR